MVPESDGWSKSRRLTKEEISKVPNVPGAYQILVECEIQRLSGVDKSGVLHIGTSQTLRKRLNDFLACASRKRQSGHAEGLRYIEFRVDRIFSLETLKFIWKKTAPKQHSRNLELKSKRQYISKYGELPPLNHHL